MKSLAKNFTSSLIDFSGKLFRCFAAGKVNRKKRALVFSPSWEGSIGDEAVIKASVDYLAIKLGYEVDLLTLDVGSPYGCVVSISNYINIPGYFKNGGWRDRIRLVKILTNYERFILLGTDSLDGHYTEWQSLGLLTLAHQAAKSGMLTTVAGISMQEKPKQSCVAKLKKISEYSNATVCVRDAVSKARIGTEVSKARVTADPAFLLYSLIDTPNAAEIYEWVDVRHSEGALVIGVNISSHAIQTLEGEPVGSLEDSFVEAMVHLCPRFSQALAVVIIPHDLREHCDDLAICQSIADKLSRATDCRTIVYKPKITAASVKALAGKMDYVFSGRMHLAIATLGAGVPVGCVTYQGKFEGLFQHFTLEGLTISPSEALDSIKLGEFLERGIAGREGSAAIIANRLLHVRELAKENFN